MPDPNRRLEPVSCRYGAPMGRPPILDDRAALVTVFRVRMYDGDYDRGGAYWGGGTPLYCAIGRDFRAFVRATGRDDAIRQLADDHPELRFRKGARS